MPQSPVSAFETTVNEAHVWLKDLQMRAGLDTEQQAYTVLRAVLQALRDRLTVNEAAHLGAQLPMLVRGVYFEAWKPAASPRKDRTRAEFLQHVRDRMRADALIDAEDAVHAVFGLLEEKITPGEIEDVKSILPGAILELWPSVRTVGGAS